jgi:hypothetical protein
MHVRTVLADHLVSDDELSLPRCVCMALNVPIPRMEPVASQEAASEE